MRVFRLTTLKLGITHAMTQKQIHVSWENIGENAGIILDCFNVQLLPQQPLISNFKQGFKGSEFNYNGASWL